MSSSSRIRRRLERPRESSAQEERTNRLIFIGIIAAFVIAIAVVFIKNRIESGPVNLNDASAARLETLPGIGPDTAKLIIQGRPYTTIDDLDKVKGIGPATLEKLRPRVTVGD